MVLQYVMCQRRCWLSRNTRTWLGCGNVLNQLVLIYIIDTHNVPLSQLFSFECIVASFHLLVVVRLYNGFLSYDYLTNKADSAYVKSKCSYHINKCIIAHCAYRQGVESTTSQFTLSRSLSCVYLLEKKIHRKGYSFLLNHCACL